MPKFFTAVVGNVVSKKEVREIGTKGEDSENYVFNFRIATNENRYDRKAKEWVSDDTNFIPVTVWGKKAINIEESLQVGNPVIVVGFMKMKKAWENKEGEEVEPSQYLDATYVGIDVGAATGESHRKPKSDGSSNSNDSSGKSSSASSKSKASSSKSKTKEEKSKPDDDFDLDLDLDLGDDDTPGF